MIVRAPLSADPQGFISQECPSCGKIFKALFGQGSKKTLAFCPYCDFEGQCWTVKQIKYLECVALNQGGPQPPPCPIPPESNGPKNIYKYSCHGDQIKHDGSQGEFYCIVCGEKPKKKKKPKR